MTNEDTPDQLDFAVYRAVKAIRLQWSNARYQLGLPDKELAPVVLGIPSVEPLKIYRYTRSMKVYPLTMEENNGK